MVSGLLNYDYGGRGANEGELWIAIFKELLGGEVTVTSSSIDYLVIY